MINPTCGTNGVIYQNSCLALEAGTGVRLACAYWRGCRTAANCVRPNCAADCLVSELGAARAPRPGSLQPAHASPPRVPRPLRPSLPPPPNAPFPQAAAKPSCRCNYLSPTAPVCATDGTVYSSPCLLACAGATQRFACTAGTDCVAACLAAKS